MPRGSVSGAGIEEQQRSEKRARASAERVRPNRATGGPHERAGRRLHEHGLPIAAELNKGAQVGAASREGLVDLARPALAVDPHLQGHRGRPVFAALVRGRATRA